MSQYVYTNTTRVMELISDILNAVGNCININYAHRLVTKYNLYFILQFLVAYTERQ